MCYGICAHALTEIALQLWRVEFLDEDIGMEDLEELEVQSAIAAYKALTIALQSTGPSGLPPGWKRIPRDDQGHYQVTVSSQTLKPP